jgi:hypothetical protein
MPASPARGAATCDATSGSFGQIEIGNVYQFTFTTLDSNWVRFAKLMRTLPLGSFCQNQGATDLGFVWPASRPQTAGGEVCLTLSECTCSGLFGQKLLHLEFVRQRDPRAELGFVRPKLLASL